MMMRSHILLFTVGFMLLVAIGCQGHGAPTAPQTSDEPGLVQPPLSPVRQAFEWRSGHQLLALVECRVDAEAGIIDVEPLRTAGQHLDLIQLIPIYCHPVSACLKFINIQVDEPTFTVELDVVVKHPINDPFADVYDMRGIGIFKGILPGFAGGSIATQIQNADGYTTAYDVDGDYDAFLNPYVAFNEDLPDRVFAHGSQTMEHIIARFPSFSPSDSKFLYALDSSWVDPSKVDPEDPLTHPNIPEPYQVNILYIDPISDEFLSEGTAVVEALDWQENAADGEMEVPDLFGGPLDLAQVWSSGVRHVYYGNVVNDKEAGSGQYPVLAKINDEFESQPDLVDPTKIVQLDSYQLGSVSVYESAANSAPTASVVTSGLIIQPGGSVHFDATGSSDPEDGSISTYAWDLDGTWEFNDGDTAEVDHQYNENGIFMANVMVSDSEGLTDILDVPLLVHVNPGINTPPVAVASASNYYPAIGEEITLDASESYDLEDGKPVSWEWELDNDGDYNDASGEIIDHSWSSAGVYNVDVLVKDSGGLGDVLDTKLRIEVTTTGNQPPVAIAEADKYTAGVGEEIIFDGTDSYDPEDGPVSQYMWDFDGNKDYLDGFLGIIGHKFWDPGTYEVDLKVLDSHGLSDTLDEPLVIEITGQANQPPVAVAKASKYVVDVDELVHFDGTDSYDPEEGGVKSYAWDLDGDGWYFDAFSAEVDWWYTKPGVYYVDLKVCDTPGLCDYLDTPLVIQVIVGGNQPPVAVAYADKPFCYEGDTVYFDGADSYDPEDGSPVSWQWDLDEDGQYDDSPFILASKTYPTEGVYWVDLKVTDSLGTWDTLDEVIVITVVPPGSNLPPIAAADVNCAFPIVGQKVHFTSQSSDPDGQIVKWEWDFGDGLGWRNYTSTQGDAKFGYGDEGVFQADLRVTDDLGATDQLNAPITMYVSKPGFNVPTEPPSCPTNATHSFSSASAMQGVNTSIDARDIAVLASGRTVAVFCGKLYQFMVSFPMEPPLMENADWVRSIDATSSGFLALSGLTDGIIKLYEIPPGPVPSLTHILDISVGAPVSAVTFDGDNNVWVYTQGEIRQYSAPSFEFSECRVFDVSAVEAVGRVDDMEFNIWNHSLYLSVSDGANGTVVEVTYLGEIGATLSDVLLGPANYVDIVIDKDVVDLSSAACRMVVMGGVQRGYLTRLDADLNIMGQMTFGYWGIRSAALDPTRSNIIVALEDCCLSWIDMFTPPSDWADEE